MRCVGILAFVGLVGCARATAPGSLDSGPGSGTDGSDQQSCDIAACDDNDMCTVDSCTNEGTCAHSANSCDDGDACTTDTCDSTTGCAHTNMNHGMQTFAPTGALQTFAVPACVTSLHVLAAGGQGGSLTGLPGGMGATLEGDFVVTPAESLSIVVGGAGVYGVDGAAGYAQRGGTGGGGSFVVNGSTIFVIAGGGGGASGGTANPVSASAPGGPGQITTAAQAGSGLTPGGAGGVNGGGGTTFSNSGGYQGGTGGGGYSSNGVNNSDGAGSYGSPNTPGIAYVNGAAGGVGGSASLRNGGFGGGGSSGFTGGGGGGYSGGGGGSYGGGGAGYSGGGGGSINNGTTPANVAGNHAGAGTVVVTW